jgi:peptide/nickel transport system permease protein
MVKLFKRLNAEKAAVLASLFIICILSTFVFLGDLIVPNSPTQANLQDRLKPPAWQGGGIMKYPLGTDSLGRCILSRIISGTKYTLGIAIISILISAFIGVTGGLVSGFAGGFVDTAIMRFVDLSLAFPILVLGMLLAVTLGPSVSTLIIILVIIQWARFARQVRGEALSLKETDFVAQARVAGCSSVRIVFRHLLPNVMNTVLVLMTLQVGWAILMESGLSFLGAGMPPPKPGWGLMVANGMEYVATAWWVSLVPGFAIMVAVLAFNTLGDSLRDWLDPRLRQL